MSKNPPLKQKSILKSENFWFAVLQTIAEVLGVIIFFKVIPVLGVAATPKIVHFSKFIVFLAAFSFCVFLVGNILIGIWRNSNEEKR